MLDEVDHGHRRCRGEVHHERPPLVGRQLKAGLTGIDGETLATRITVAYEPVWAIGTGQTATPDQAQAMHALIRAEVAALDAATARQMRVLYGGSMNTENARMLLGEADIDGGLIGGASLQAAGFGAIAAAASAAAG